MAKKRERAFALFLAGLFLLTSSALTIGIIVQSVQNKNDKSATATTPEVKKVDPSKQLQGKPLAGFTPVASIAGLQAIDSTPGTGEAVKAGDTVTVDYTGAVAATGTVFQSSLDSGQPLSFPLSGVIAGWSQGIPGMKVGGTRRLLIPANLAYGASPPAGSGIPANADLVFDVTLHKIGQ
ncbi:peptidylprolyl isomerase [Candidatus Saccharibacteria bacterium CG_4_10_14_0_2_um_filter_52_9]|nr:MAG: peptidylprolyl isomerase [Candidatus Saccharibacteria bacterium CG_4_10_14_0_2_um_filter_52_9]